MNIFSVAMRSYLNSLRSWAGSMASGYIVGVGLVAAGSVFALVVLGVGSVYAFRYIEMRYGTDLAFASLAGSNALLAVVFLVSGFGMIRRAGRPLPSPAPEVMMIKREVSENAAAIVPRLALSANHEAKAVVALSAASFLIWLASPRRKRP